MDAIKIGPLDSGDIEQRVPQPVALGLWPALNSSKKKYKKVSTENRTIGKEKTQEIIYEFYESILDGMIGTRFRYLLQYVHIPFSFLHNLRLLQSDANQISRKDGLGITLAATDALDNAPGISFLGYDALLLLKTFFASFRRDFMRGEFFVFRLPPPIFSSLSGIFPRMI